MLSINSVFIVAPNRKFLFEGIVRFLRTDNKENAALIKLDFKNIRDIKSPFTIKLNALVDAIENNIIIPYNNFETGFSSFICHVNETTLAELDKFYEKMRPIFDNNDVLFSPSVRSEVLKNFANSLDLSIRTIRRRYNRFYWGGQKHIFLAPAFYRRGRRGEDQNIGTKRRGRRCKSSENLFEGKPSKSLVCGYNEKDIFNDYYEKYVIKGTYTVQQAFEQLKRDHYSDGVEVIYDDNGIATERVKLLPEENLPTLRQFRYAGKKLELVKGKRNKHPSHKRPYINKSPKRGTARDNVPGPCYRFEIDATIFQTQLVSRYGRRHRVGTATVYFVIDVWSGAIVGHCVSLESAKWSLAARALRNCFTDKQEIFDRLQMPYKNADWPCKEAPMRLLADRGEMASDKAKSITESGIIIELTASGRGDRKGSIESAINRIKHSNLYDLPGKFIKRRKRTESDGKITAALNIIELETIIVERILDANKFAGAYIPHEMLRNGNNNVSYINVYSWGLENRPGFSFNFTQQEFIPIFLTKGYASVKPDGIYFKHQLFKCERLYENQYLHRAARSGNYKVEIRYDELMADRIYFFDDKIEKWVPAENSDKEIFQNKYAFFEIDAFYIDLQNAKKLTNTSNIQSQLGKKDRIKNMTKTASAEAKEANKGYSKKDQKKDIRRNKQIDIVGSQIRESVAAQIDSPPLINHLESVKLSREKKETFNEKYDQFDDDLDDITNAAWEKTEKITSEEHKIETNPNSH